MNVRNDKSQETNLTASSGIVPDSFKDGSYNLMEQISLFKTLIESENLEGARNSIVDIAKYILGSRVPPEVYMESGFVDLTVQILSQNYPSGSGKFKMIAIHKNCFVILINLVNQHFKIAQYLAENKIFEILLPFIANTDDNFTTCMTLSLFSKIMDSNSEYQVLCFGSGLIPVLLELLQKYLSQSPSTVAKQLQDILQFFTKCFGYLPNQSEQIIEYEQVMQMIDAYYNTLIHIEKDLLADFDPLNPNFSVNNYYNETYITTAVAISNVADITADFILNCVKIIEILNKKLQFVMLDKTWKSTLEMNIKVIRITKENKDFVNELLQTIDIAKLIQFYRIRPKDDFSNDILDLLYEIAMFNPDFIDQIPYDQIIQTIIEKYSKMSFAQRCSAVRFCLTVISCNHDEVLFVLLENVLLNSFSNIIASAPSDLKRLAITTFNTSLTRLRASGRDCDQFFEFLNGEFKDILLEIMEDDNDDNHEIAASFYSLIDS